MTDRISLTGLRAHGRHGVFDHERRQGQQFVIDVTLDCDTTAAASGDELQATVDYATLADQLVETVGGEPVNLIETLAQRLADVCLANPLVHACEVTVHKPQAPIPHAFADVSVTIRRQR